MHVGNNRTIRSQGVGEVKIETVVKGKKFYMTLNDVLYVRELM